MDMTSQLLETKLAGGGKQREEEESFGTGRGGAHNYSGGAGRAPPSADIGYGVTAVGVVAAAEVPVHSRRAASEPTTPADGIGKRPDVPAGVGPTVNMYSGEARESYLAGIAAHDGGSVRVCVCVFFTFILDIKFVGCTSRGHTGGRSHRIFHPPSFCGACLNFSREKEAIPFPRQP